MVMGHLTTRRKFKPTGSGGGSSKGKPQGSYPLIVLVVADAIFIQSKGTIDAMIHDRNMQISAVELKSRLAKILPGVWAWLDRHNPTTVTPKPELVKNRVYKMYYSGTTDRGYGHDPHTRAAMSKEHWRCRTGGTRFESIHEGLIRGEIRKITGWRKWV